MERTEKIRSIIEVTSTLFYKKRGLDNEGAEIRNAYIKNVSFETKPPYNLDEDLIHGSYCLIAKEPKITLSPSPYWNPKILYDPWEIFLTSIQFFDDHKAPLPLTTLPPEKDISEYGNKVLNSKNNIVGVGNLGMIASRIFARGGDKRAYPNITITSKIINEWNKHICPFETYENTTSNDPSGDTYYFWTHFFISLAFYILKKIPQKAREISILDNIFEIGTPTMVFVRKYIANQSTLTSHRTASILGRALGTATSMWAEYETYSL